ncbi:universal stress protein [Curvivirga aplysinae]|uniref:universal stress protein n=1 Tax=Curvivirga aplysinae TaxID=2529852 RepID=UPI0012BC31B8|nr:universal stress protein [Curvivirga aplysinae]MTI10680.1 universal stress protein [Curvivirga aplysinae]
MFNHILLAVDMEHDESWKKALPAAIQNAKAFGAALHVMTVVPDFGRSLVSSFFPSGHEDQMMEKANEALHDFVKAHIPDDVAVQHIVGYGNAYEEILRVADEVKIDLIIMGAHRPKMEDYLIGPNAARVVRHAKCSVLVVRD